MIGFFEYLDNTVMTLLRQATHGQAMVYVNGISILASGALTLFVLWKGYQVVAGKIQTPIADLVWDVSKMAIILMFINNVEGYLDTTISAVNGLKEGFAGSTNVWHLLDTLWMKTQQLGEAIYKLDDSTYFKDSGAVGRGLVWIGSMVTMVIATIIFISAEITILLLSITAPIFIFCLMWGFLRQMFNNWLQLIFSSILTLLFASLVIRVGINYLDSILFQIDAQANKYNLITMGAEACVAGIVSGFIIWLSSKFASQLAGVGVEGAIQGMASMGIGTAALGASRLSRQAGNGLGAIGQRAQNNLTGGGGGGGGRMSMSERHRKDAADMAKRIKTVTERVRRENSA